MKRIFRFFLVFLLVSTAFAVYADASEVSGVVRDGETGEVIRHASVQIVELNTGTVTDENGNFTVEDIPDGDYTIRVTVPGYAPASRKISVEGRKNLEMTVTSAPIVVDEVVSTARGRQTKLSDIPGSVEILTGDDLHETNPVGLSQALARKPGISAGADMPWGARTVIRGMSKDHVILLVDGARVVTATAVPAQFGLIGQGDIERVEVLKGPLSVLYGSGSTGGVVNVITRKGRFTPRPRLGFSLNPSYESAASGVSSYERVAFSNSRFYINLSQANRRYGDYRVAENERIPNSQFQDRQTQVNLGIRLTPRHTFEGRYQYFSGIDIGIPGGAAFPPRALVKYPTLSRSLTDLAWTWRPESTWLKQSRVNVYYQPVFRDVSVVPNVPPTIMPHPKDATKSIRLTPVSIYPRGEHYVYGFRWQNEMRFGGHDVVAGLEGWQKNMVSDRTKRIKKEIIDKDTGEPVGDPSTVVVKETPVPDSSQRPIGVFAEDTFVLGGKTEITLGGRVDVIHTENEKSYMTDQPPSDVLLWDSYSDDDFSWSFVAGAVHELTDAVDVNLTVARSFRSPTIEERYLYAELGGVLTVGDPEIDPEKGTFVEAGLTATIGGLKLTGDVFLNSITDMLIKKPGGELRGREVDYQYANAGKARLRGFEAGVDWAVLPDVLLSADVSYTRGTDEKLGTDLPAMPPARVHVSGRWNMGRGFWVEPLLTLVDRQDKVAPGERETPGYGILDISAGKSLLRTGNVTHDLAFGIKNVGDKLYRDHLTVSRGYEMYGMGRSFYVSWRMTGN